MTDLLTSREGRGQLQTLAGIVHLQYEQEEPGRVTDLVEVLPLSKGAVSNNTKKLLDQELIREQDKRFTLNEQTLFDAYREHLEQFLIREPKPHWLDDEAEERNQARSHIKRSMSGWLGNPEFREFLDELLVQALLTTHETTRHHTLREVFLYVDRMLDEAARVIEGKSLNTPFSTEIGLLASITRSQVKDVEEVFNRVLETKRLLTGEGELRPESRSI